MISDATLKFISYVDINIQHNYKLISVNKWIITTAKLFNIKKWEKIQKVEKPVFQYFFIKIIAIIILFRTFIFDTVF